MTERQKERMLEAYRLQIEHRRRGREEIEQRRKKMEEQKSDVSERYLQCSANHNRCIKNNSGIRKQSLNKCLDCKYSLISERPFANMPTMKIEYHEDKDNWTEELWKRTL